MTWFNPDVSEAPSVEVCRVDANPGAGLVARRRLWFFGLLSTCVVLAAASAPAEAQSTDRGSDGGPHSSRRAEQNCRGRLLSLRTVAVPGSGHTHVIATLRGDDGRVILADLGALKDLKNTNLRAGQQVEASGRSVRIDKTPVLIVTRLRSPGGRPQTVTSGRRSSASDAAQIVKGTITDTRGMKIKGSSQPHTLVKVRTRDGQTRVIDLGPTGVRRDAMLHEGAFLAARGQPARLSGRPVLRAREFSDGSRVWPAFGITRRTTLGAADAVRTVRGTVTDLREVSLKGLSDRHALLKLRTADGWHLVVDVGSEASAESLGLKRGDVVAAKGPMGRTNAKPVLFAQQVAQVLTVDRSPPMAAASAGQQASATQPSASPQQDGGPLLPTAMRHRGRSSTAAEGGESARVC